MYNFFKNNTINLLNNIIFYLRTLLFKDSSSVFIIIIILFFVQRGIRQQNLSHLNRTHKKEKKINLYSTFSNNFRYIQKII